MARNPYGFIVDFMTGEDHKRVDFSRLQETAELKIMFLKCVAVRLTTV